MNENYNFNDEIPSPLKLNSINELTKDNIYLRTGNTMAEVLLKND